MPTMNKIFNRKPIRIENGIAVFSETDFYVKNYQRIAADHVKAIGAGIGNPFIDDCIWRQIEDSTRILVEKYLSPGAKVLDVGVGLGRLLGDLDHYERHGMDISFDYLHEARRKGIEVIFSRIEDMPYRDDFFDAVTVTDVLEHVIDLNACCAQIMRVLKPGGLLFVRVPYKEDLSSYLADDYPYEYVHLRNFDAEGLRALFGKMFGCTYMEHATAVPFYFNPNRMKFRLPRADSRLAELLKDIPTEGHDLSILKRAYPLTEDEVANWLYDKTTSNGAILAEIAGDILNGVEINAVFRKPAVEEMRPVPERHKCLSEKFDGVVICAKLNETLGSYGKQFARILPILTCWSDGESDILKTVTDFLSRHRIKRLLLITDAGPEQASLIKEFPNAFLIEWRDTDGEISGREADLLWARSPQIISGYRETGFMSPAILVENGCDDDALIAAAANQTERKFSDRAVAVFCGPIDERLDLVLLHQLLHLLPHWDFRFYGPVTIDGVEWEIVKSHPNFTHSLEETKAYADATTAIWPINVRSDIPPASQEFFSAVAYGVPVISTPIQAPQGDERIFKVARSAEDFAAAMNALSSTRYDRAALEARRNYARRTSMAQNFKKVSQAIISAHDALLNEPKKLNIAVLYEDRECHIGTIREHVESFRKYSRHNIYYLPATKRPLPSNIHATKRWRASDEEMIDFHLDLFDVVIFHYAVRLSLPDYFSGSLARQMDSFRGLKLLFIQDEYEATEMARSWMDRIKFDIVYTCIPPEGRETIYPAARFPRTDFLPTLTGYVPETRNIDAFAIPMAERKTLIGYRGRMLDPVYGMLGHEKYKIGVEMDCLAKERGLPVDIEVDDTRRIYGNDWYRFLGSCRATLGTESGSNIFDFDRSVRASIAASRAANPDITFEDLYQELLSPLDGLVKMNQLSPKIFEAIRLGTALILFEGEYSGVVTPDVHYILLKKDFSNVDDVFAKLQDMDYISELTARAYADIIESEKYSYRSFIEGIDRDIAHRVIHQPRCELFSTPVLARDANGMWPVMPDTPLGYSLSTGILHGNFQRDHLFATIAQIGDLPQNDPAPQADMIEPLPAEIVEFIESPVVVSEVEPIEPKAGYDRRSWPAITPALRYKIRMQAAARLYRINAHNQASASDKILRIVWRTILPEATRVKIRARIWGAR